MKEKVKILISSILLILMVFSCDMLPFGDDDDKKDDKQEQPEPEPEPDPDPDPDPGIQLAAQVESVVNDFIETLTGLSLGSRAIDKDAALNATQIAQMKKDIIEELDSQNLTNSTNLKDIISTVTETAQTSLSSQWDESDKLTNLGAIAKASMDAVGKNKSKTSFEDDDLEEIVGEVSEVLVKNISKMGIPKNKIVAATKEAVETVVASLDSVEIDSDNVSTFVQKVSNSSAIALASNQGIDAAVLQDALAATSTSAIDALEDIEKITLNDTLRSELTKDISGAVAQSLDDIQDEFADKNITINIQVTVIVQHITVQSINEAVRIQEDIHGEEIDDSFIADMKSDLLAGSFESLITMADENEKDQWLQDYENSLLDITEDLGITEDDIDQAIVKGEVDATPVDSLNAAEKLELAKKQLRVGSWSGARDLIYDIVKNHPASEIPSETYLWWAALKIAHITVSQDMIDLAKQVGLADYPDTMEGLFSSEFTEGQTIQEESRNNFDENGNPEIYTHFLPRVEDKFNIMGEDLPLDITMEDYFLILMANLVLSNPDGLNEFYDKLLKASDVMDEVTAKLRSLDDGLSIALDFEMFNDIAYSVGTGWPEAEVTEPGEPAGPDQIVIGKAEVTALSSIFEVMRMVGHMGQAVSLAGDLDGYWGAFNPITGKAYTFTNTGRINGMDPTYDWAELKSPFSNDLLHNRDETGAIMTKANQHFINFLSDIKKASELLVARDSESPFTLSPATMGLGEAWEILSTVQSMTSIMLGKIINSLKAPVDASIPVYFPQVPFEGSDAEMEAFVTLYGDENNWPDANDSDAIEVNFSMFKKPFHAIDNLVDLKANGEPNIYIMKDSAYVLANKADYEAMNEDSVFYIKLLDITLGGMTPDLHGLLPGDMEVQEGGSLFIPIPGDVYGFLGHALYAANEIFPYKGDNYKSTGSFFTGLIKHEIDFKEIVVLSNGFSHDQYKLLEQFEKDNRGLKVRVENLDSHDWETPYTEILKGYFNDEATDDADTPHIVFTDNGGDISDVLDEFGELQDQAGFIDSNNFQTGSLATATYGGVDGLWAVPIGKEFYSVLFVNKYKSNPTTYSVFEDYAEPSIHLADDGEDFGALENLYSSILTRYATTTYIDAYGTSSSFEDEEHTKTIAFIQKMVNDGILKYTDYFLQDFRDGNLPYILAPSYYYGKIKWQEQDYYDGFNDFYMTLLPSIEGEDKTTNGMYLEGYAILKTVVTENKILDEAKKVLNYLLGEEMSRARAYDMGIIPVFEYNTGDPIGMGIDDLAQVPVIATATDADAFDGTDRDTLKAELEGILDSIDKTFYNEEPEGSEETVK